GHRGTGKTSLVEAMLFQAGKVNRLGSVEQGSTVSDWDDDEHRRQMSLSGSLEHLEWQERKINLLDTPGDAGFQSDTYASLRCVAIHLPIGAEHELTGIVDLLHMCAYLDPSGAREEGPQPIPDEMADQVQEYREKLLDAVVETDEELMARYLDGEELPAEDVAHALKDAVTRDELYPVACGVATKNLGTTALLDLLVEGVPSPAKKGTTIEFGDAKQAIFVYKTIADPFAG